MSERDCAEVWLAAVTAISTVPTVPIGTVADRDVSVRTVNDAAGLFPKLTAVEPVKPLPVIVMTFPPEVGPLEGLTEVISGAAAR